MYLALFQPSILIVPTTACSRNVVSAPSAMLTSKPKTKNNIPPHTHTHKEKKTTASLALEDASPLMKSALLLQRDSAECWWIYMCSCLLHLQLKGLCKPKHDPENVCNHQVEANQRVEPFTRSCPSYQQHLWDERNLAMEKRVGFVLFWCHRFRAK